MARQHSLISARLWEKYLEVKWSRVLHACGIPRFDVQNHTFLDQVPSLSHLTRCFVKATKQRIPGTFLKQEMCWHCLLGSLGKMNKTSPLVFLELSASGAFETKWYFLQTEVKRESYCGVW